MGYIFDKGKLRALFESLDGFTKADIAELSGVNRGRLNKLLYDQKTRSMSERVFESLQAVLKFKPEDIGIDLSQPVGPGRPRKKPASCPRCGYVPPK